MSDYKQFCNEHNFPCNKASAAAWEAYIKEESVEFVMGWSRSYFDERFKARWDRKATDKDWDHFSENYDEINFDVVCESIEALMDEVLTDSFWNCSECDKVEAGTYDADHAPTSWSSRLCQDCFTKMAVPCRNCGDEFVLQDNDDAFECHWKHKKDGIKIFWFCCVGCKDDYKYGHDHNFDNFHDYKEAEEAETCVKCNNAFTFEDNFFKGFNRETGGDRMCQNCFAEEEAEEAEKKVNLTIGA